jgi:hypothetical protein
MHEAPDLRTQWTIVFRLGSANSSSVKPPTDRKPSAMVMPYGMYTDLERPVDSGSFPYSPAHGLRPHPYRRSVLSASVLVPAREHQSGGRARLLSSDGEIARLHQDSPSKVEGLLCCCQLPIRRRCKLRRFLSSRAQGLSRCLQFHPCSVK